jgi:threonine dehydratase
MSLENLSADNIHDARRRIAPLVRRTPFLPSSALTQRHGAAVLLKLETLQETGTFKVRGAANKILSLPERQRERGVVTASTGNHGRAVSHVARALGVRAVVCISERVPQNKVEALRRSGAELVIEGESQDEAAERALALQAERGLTMIHPFDDPSVIAGQGTMGLEMLDVQPELDAVLIPLSGGGLIAGVALALKSALPSLRVVGVSMERSPVMYHSLEAGHPVQMPEEETLADSLLGGIGLENQYTFDLVRQLVDEVVLVSEEEIARGMRFLLREEHVVAEGAGAVGIAALLANKVGGAGDNISVVISGGNVALDTLMQVMQN